MFKDLKKFQAELDKYNDVNYASKVEIDCVKAKGDLMSYKIDFEKSSNANTRKINDLNQMISDMKKELCAHQETISIMSQAKEAQIKLYKTQEMVADLKYVNSLEDEVDNLKSQMETQKTQLLNEIDRLSREYYYADHMNAILGIYTDLDEFTDLQCDYGEPCKNGNVLKKKSFQRVENVKSFESLQKTWIILNLITTVVKPAIFSDSLAKKDFSKSKPITTQNVSNNFSKPVTAQILPQNRLPIVQNTNVIAPGMRIPNTCLADQQLKSNYLEDRVLSNNSQGKKQEVEDHSRKLMQEAVRFKASDVVVTVLDRRSDGVLLLVHSASRVTIDKKIVVMKLLKADLSAGTDIAHITRKQSKPDKHRHRNG
ncbi:hypothetical protein Tco_1185541 [Tanacetum coccineum]